MIYILTTENCREQYAFASMEDAVSSINFTYPLHAYRHTVVVNNDTKYIVYVCGDSWESLITVNGVPLNKEACYI